MNRRTVLKFLGLIPAAPALANVILEQKPKGDGLALADIERCRDMMTRFGYDKEVWHCQVIKIDLIPGGMSTVDLQGALQADNEILGQWSYSRYDDKLDKWEVERHDQADTQSGIEIRDIIDLTVRLDKIPFPVALGDWVTIKIDRS